MDVLPGPVTKSSRRMPERASSSTTYWTTGFQLRDRGRQEVVDMEVVGHAGQRLVAAGPKQPFREGDTGVVGGEVGEAEAARPKRVQVFLRHADRLGRGRIKQRRQCRRNGEM